MTQREAWNRWHATHQVESTAPPALIRLHHVEKLALKRGAVFLDVGVGVGDMARFIATMGITVDCIDISDIAGAQVHGIARRFYLAEEIEDLPSREYHLALSHLVAQHTEDVDFAYQTAHIYRALRYGGTYSIQFAGSDLGLASRVAPSMVEVGHVVRAPGDAIALCQYAAPGAAVKLIAEPERWATTNTGDETFYYYVHVTKPRVKS